jgi:hypothetical protein
MFGLTGLSKGFLHDGADGSDAAAAIRTAAKTAIDLRGRAGAIRPWTQTGFHVAVGEDVAGANDHEALV